MEACDKIGSTVARTGAHGVLGEALALSGEMEAARQSLEFSLQLGRDEKLGRYFEPQFLAGLSEVQLALGDAPRGQSLAEEAVAIASRTGQRVGEIRALLARARLLLAGPGVADRDEIESTLNRARSLVASTGARAHEPQILVERARLSDLLSDGTDRDRWLNEAHRLFTEMGATGHAERVATRLADRA